MFDGDITVYNYYRKKDGTEIWKRTEVFGIMWNQKVDRVVSDGKLSFVRTTSITIPDTIECLKRYVDYKTYKTLDESALSEYWTLDPTNNMDTIVFGVSKQDITADYRISDLISDSPYVTTVMEVADRRNAPGLKHIKVVGK